MKVPLLFCFLLVTLMPLLIQARFLAGFFRQSQIEESMIEAQSKCLMIANKMVALDYVNNPTNNPGLDAEMNVTADLFNGRIIVIDSSFKVIKDTFDLTKGKTSVVEEVLRSFEGETINRRNKKKDYFYLTLPVYSKADAKKAEGVLLMTASTESMALLESQVMHKAGFLQFVLLCFVIAVDFLAASFLMKPFRKLQERLNLVSEGNLDQDIQVEDYKETKGISDAVSQTLKKLKAVDQSRQEFVSNVSHEFKTPLATISGYATLLQDDTLTPQERNEYIETIITSARELSKMTGNILSLSRLENQTIITDQEDFRVDEQIRWIILRAESAWSAKNLVLEPELDKITWYGNQELTSHIWSNLIDNAIKFTPAGGEITIKASMDEEWLTVSVQDSGIGIPPDIQSRIFDKFYQGDTSHKKKGNGLGLALVHQIVTLYGGHITLESIPDLGSTFTVCLPAHPSSELESSLPLP